jgi:hypothetical protein
MTLNKRGEEVIKRHFQLCEDLRKNGAELGALTDIRWPFRLLNFSRRLKKQIMNE